MLPVERSIDISTTGNWAMVYSDVKTAGNLTTAERRVRGRLLDPFDIPFTINAQVIAVIASYASAPATWYNAGQLIQVAPAQWSDQITLPDQFPGEPVAVLNRLNIRLNYEPEVFELNLSTSEAYLTFFPRPWIPQLTIGIWAYQGAINDQYLAELGAIRAKLEVIDSQVGA